MHCIALKCVCDKMDWMHIIDVQHFSEPLFYFNLCIYHMVGYIHKIVFNLFCVYIFIFFIANLYTFLSNRVVYDLEQSQCNKLFLKKSNSVVVCINVNNVYLPQRLDVTTATSYPSPP